MVLRVLTDVHGRRSGDADWRRCCPCFGGYVNECDDLSRARRSVEFSFEQKWVSSLPVALVVYTDGLGMQRDFISSFRFASTTLNATAELTAAVDSE